MHVQLSQFMVAFSDAIVDEWQAAGGPAPARTHAREATAWRQVLKDVVLSIACGMQHAGGPPPHGTRSSAEAASSRNAAARHGALRQGHGIGSAQLVGEFGQLRTAVLARWHYSGSRVDGAVVLEQALRFNQAVDAVLRDSIDGLAAASASARDAYLFALGQDLRLPLATLQAANTVLGRPDFALDTRRTASRRVQRALIRMEGLLSDLMEYTRTRGITGIPVERTPGDLRLLCEESIELARTAHPGRIFEAGFSGDLAASFDGPRLQQALSNLLHNAVVHGDGVTPVRLTALATRTSVSVSVWNAGPVIAAASMRTLFEPRMRTPSPDPSAPGRGTASLGLGLFIVREIAAGHGGEVDAVSTEAGGTRLTIRLPRVFEDAPAGAASMQAMAAVLSDRSADRARQERDSRVSSRTADQDH